jgi:hypothetical protein
VVCRYCRKQTSITAHTLMHGSKKNLVAWMRVASQFCFHDQGISARELQRLMKLSCYQTAWNWLQKMRRGAALAESTPCRGTVLFDIIPLQISAVPKRTLSISELPWNRTTTSRNRYEFGSRCSTKNHRKRLQLPSTRLFKRTQPCSSVISNGWI